MRAVAAVLVLLISCLSSALPYGSEVVSVGEAKVPFSITGFNSDPIRTVSGTNVGFAVTVGPLVAQGTIDEPASYWHPKEVNNLTLKIGGESVALQLPPAENMQWAKAVTFQSNRFPHNSVQQIEVTVTATFEEIAWNMEGVPQGTVLETRVKSNTVTVECKIYNDLLSWRTTVDFQGNPGPSADSYPSVAEVGLDVVKPKFLGMKHAAPDTKTMAALSISGPPPPNATGGRLKHATGIFSFTHGSVTFVEDSNHVPIHTSTNNGGHAAFLEARSTRAPEHPPFNFGIYYACLMASNTTWFGVHFFPLPPEPLPTEIKNQFFAGFTDIVFSLLKPGDPADMIKVKRSERLQVMSGRLSSHAQEFISRLEAGQTAEVALSEANRLFPPRGLPSTVEEPSEETDELEKVDYFPLLNMILQGDGKSTMNTVYGYTDALNNPASVETFSSWYITRNQP